jgi:hypothetical protein
MRPLKPLGLIYLVLASSIVAARQMPSNMGVLTCTAVRGKRGLSAAVSSLLQPAERDVTSVPSDKAEHAFRANKLSSGLFWRPAE